MLAASLEDRGIPVFPKPSDYRIQLRAVVYMYQFKKRPAMQLFRDPAKTACPSLIGAVHAAVEIDCAFEDTWAGNRSRWLP